MDGNAMQLSINGDAFWELREEFDDVLTRTISNMELKSSDEATLTMKLKIMLEKAVVNDPRGGYGATREISIPTFIFKVNSVMQVKDEQSGALTGNYELVWDKTRRKYIMRPVDDGQIGMEDMIEGAEELEYEAPDTENTED